MKLILRETESGDEKDIVVAKNVLIVSLKTKCQEIFPATRGKMIQLFSGGVQEDLKDSKYVGDYKFIKPGSRVDVIVPSSQPYSNMDYAEVQKKLEENLKRKSLEEFFDPKEDENDWDKDWTKWDEYLNYPPVGVQGKEGVLTNESASGGNIWKDSGKNVEESDQN